MFSCESSLFITVLKHPHSFLYGLLSTDCSYERLFFLTERSKSKTKKGMRLLPRIVIIFAFSSVCDASPETVSWVQIIQNSHPCDNTVKLFCGCSCNPHAGVALRPALSFFGETVRKSSFTLLQSQFLLSILWASWVRWVLAVVYKAELQ